MPQSKPEDAAKPWLAQALAAVSEHGCHWPLGDTASEAEFRFCGVPVARPPEHAVFFPPLASVPCYCPRHYREAYLDSALGETQEDRARARRKAGL